MFLTTHYMDEAEALADRIAVIVDGAIAARGTPADLGGRERERPVIRFDLPPGTTSAELPVQDGMHVAGGKVEVRADRPTATLAAITAWASERGIELSGLDVRRPSLEDIYLRLTGGR